MKIGVDLDNVVVPLYEEMIRLVKEKYGIECKKEDWKKYRMCDSFGITEEQLEQLYKEMCLDDTLLKIKPIKGAVETINKYSNDFEFYFITARYELAKKKTLEWFRNSGLIYKEENIFFDSEKAGLANKFGIKYFIDDNIDVVLNMAKYGIVCLLYNQPWNKELLEDGVMIKRVYSWKDIDENFKNILNKK